MPIVEALIGEAHSIHDHVIRYDCIDEHVDVMMKADQLPMLHWVCEEDDVVVVVVVVVRTFGQPPVEASFS